MQQYPLAENVNTSTLEMITPENPIIMPIVIFVLLVRNFIAHPSEEAGTTRIHGCICEY